MALTNVWIASFFGPPPAAIGATPVWIAPNDGTVPSAVQSVIAGYFTAVAGASPVWIAGFFAPPPAAIGATPICISGWSGSGGGGGAATSVWSASDAAANGMTLSNGGLTVAATVAGFKTVRGSISKTSGTSYVEFLFPATGGNGSEGISSVYLAGDLGTANYSAGVQYGATPVSAGFTANYTTTQYPGAGSVMGLAIDFTAGSIWIALNNVWVNSSNPATGSLPIISFVPATVGALFPAVSTYNVGDTCTLQPTAASQKYLPPPGFQAWDGGPVTPPASSVWSASDAAAADVPMTLTNGGLTVLYAGTANWQSIRSSISKTSGKLYVEFKVTTATSGAVVFGLADAGFSLSAPLGNNSQSCGILSAFSQNLVTSAFTSNYIPTGIIPAVNDVWALAVDFAAGTIWIAQNNVWFGSSNPATASLPIVSFVPATAGALFVGVSFHASGQGTWTLQPTAAAQKYLPPPGFQAWDGGPVTPPASSVWSASDAAANAMTLSNGGLTVTASSNAVWQSIRGSIGKTSGKLYVEISNSVTATALYLGQGMADAGYNPVGTLGSSPISFGVSYANGFVATSGFTVLGTVSTSPINAGDVLAIAVDFAAQRVWIALNNVWISTRDLTKDPSNGALPFATFTTTAALFPAISLAGSGTGVWTLQPTAASQKYAPPAGFSPWG